MNPVFRDDNNNNLLCKRNKSALSMLQTPSAYVTINGLVSSSQPLPTQSTMQPNLLQAPIASQTNGGGLQTNPQTSFFAAPSFLPGNVLSTHGAGNFNAMTNPLQQSLMPYLASINGILTASNAPQQFPAANGIIQNTSVAAAAAAAAAAASISAQPPTLLLTAPSASNPYTPLGLNASNSTNPLTFPASAAANVFPTVFPSQSIKTVSPCQPAVSTASIKLPISPSSTAAYSSASIKAPTVSIAKTSQPNSMLTNPVSTSPMAISNGMVVKKPVKVFDKPQLQEEELSEEMFTESALETCEYHKNKILECIDKLKERKARPDCDRISCLMKRLYGIPNKVTAKCLEHLAEVGSVVCVDYKGYVSYRNPSKWRRTSVSNGVANHPSVSQKLIEAVKVLIERQNSVPNVDGRPQPNGFTLAEVEKVIMKQEGFDVDSFKRENGDNVDMAEAKRTALSEFTPSLRLCIEREVLTGGLSKSADGRYALDESGDKKRAYAALLFNKKSLSCKSYTKQRVAIARSIDSQKTKPLFSKHISIAPNISSKSTTPVYTPILDSGMAHPMLIARRGRPPGSKKNPKNLNPKSAAATTVPSCIAPSLPGVNCISSVGRKSLLEQNKTLTSPTSLSSLKTANTVLKEENITENEIKPLLNIVDLCCRCNEHSKINDELLKCTDCGISAHPSCLDYWPQLTQRARECGWQCGDCKNCVVCQEKNSTQFMYICDACDQGYHAGCHKPALTEKHDENIPWVCSKCVSDGYSLSVMDDKQKSPKDSSTPNNEEGKKSLSFRESTICKEESKVPILESVLKFDCPLEQSVAEKENSIPKQEKQEPVIIETVIESRKRNFEESNPVSKQMNSSNSSVITSPIKQLKSECDTSPRPAIKESPKIVLESTIDEMQDTLTPNLPENNQDIIPVERPEDVRKWSVAHVKNWLHEQGYEKESESFLNEEIDGTCLLLMKKMEILTNLGIKLGPAVKIFEKIKNLQTTNRNSLST